MPAKLLFTHKNRFFPPDHAVSTLSLVGVLEVALERLPAVLVILLLHLLTGLQTPFGDTDHKSTKKKQTVSTEEWKGKTSRSVHTSQT